MTQFDLVDESATTLPLLTRARNGRLSAAALACFAEERFRDVGGTGRDRLPQALGRDFEMITTGDADESEEAWASLSKANAGESSRVQEWRVALSEDEQFMTLAWDFAQNFLVVVPMKTTPGVRRVLKFAYLEQGIDPLVERPRFVAAISKRPSNDEPDLAYLIRP